MQFGTASQRKRLGADLLQQGKCLSLCLGSVQLLFMCLEIWTPTLLAVQLLVFYVFASVGC